MRGGGIVTTMSKIETNEPWTPACGVYLEEQIARFDREERETTDDAARLVYAVCKQALIDQRRPAAVQPKLAEGSLVISGFVLRPAVMHADGTIELGPHVGADDAK